MAEAEEFSTTGTIQCAPLEGDTLLLGRGARGAVLPPGQYQIGPFTVTPSDDQSGMLQYVVHMQDALREAVQALHQKELSITQLSQQVSQLTEEKNHVTMKLDVVTRTVQEKDARMRSATQEVEKLKRSYEELEKEDPRKAAAGNKKLLIGVRKDFAALKQVERELKTKVKDLVQDKEPLQAQVKELQDQLLTSAGGHKTLEEQLAVCQEQVAALTWRLQAFEQQYTALCQQYSATMRADHPAQEGDLPQLTSLLPPVATLEAFSPPSGPAVMSGVRLSSEGAPPGGSETSHRCSNCGWSQSGKTSIPRTIHRKRHSGLPVWLPERFASVLSLRSAPRIKLFFILYLFFIHAYLFVFCLFGSSGSNTLGS